MQLFNDGWEFCRQPLHTDYNQMERTKDSFLPVGIPHDWLISQTYDLYEDGTGWYRKIFSWKKSEKEKVFLRFDGIYMDSRIYVNGALAGEWKYGYSSFETEITDFLNDGENDLRVSVDFQAPNSRWYSGAGIYRNVWIKTVPKQHLVSDGIYFTAEPGADGCWDVKICTEIETGICAETRTGFCQEQQEGLGGLVLEYAWREKGGNEFMLADGQSTQVLEGSRLLVTFRTNISHPRIWDVEHPYCYELCVTLKKDGIQLQKETQTVGFRTIAFEPQTGFLLNGRKVKLNGVCEHHDLGCLGAAFHKKAMKRKFALLKEMGVNAVRIAHNMPAPEVMELSDEMGILIVSEAFDMWESAKNPYDYARFFKEWYQKDVKSWVRRDRNHPSLIMWSIGNEIYDTHVGEQGQKWCRILMQEVRKHDPDAHAAVTIASNYMPWENAQKCADIVKNAGYNYGEKYYAQHHREHPDWVIYGSETASVVQSRGIYHFPYSQSVLTDVDEQCSALGNSTTSWGAKSPEACILAEAGHPYSCGQFIWTGFDFIGEPTPYHTRSSYFGQADTAGFPKDSYYIYQAAWTDYKEKPMVHLFPYWDFNEGQLIDVRACTNAPAVELFVNGKSQGIHWTDHAHGKNLTGHWQIPYEPGEISAVAMEPLEKKALEAGKAAAEPFQGESAGNSAAGAGLVRREDLETSAAAVEQLSGKPEEISAAAREEFRILAKDSRHSFGEAAVICLTASEIFLHADGEDLLFVEISMKDRAGRPVENAGNRVCVTAEGAGFFIGTDNGDSTDTDGYQDCSRRLFSGKLLAVFRAGTVPGTLHIKAVSSGMADAYLDIPVIEAPVRSGISALAWLPAARLAECWKLRTGGLDKTAEPEEKPGEKECAPNLDKSAAEPEDIPVRSIRLAVSGGLQLDPEHPEAEITAQICPPDASDREVIWNIVDDAGIPVNTAKFSCQDTCGCFPGEESLKESKKTGSDPAVPETGSRPCHKVRIQAVSDGSFHVRCMSRSGTEKIRVISSLGFTVQGFGKAYRNPYEFVSAGQYDYSQGEIGNGNEHGIATARDGESQIGFRGLDFGAYGSDRITIPVFALTDERYEIQIYEGMPNEGGTSLGTFDYQKPKIWNVYQEESYSLPKRLRGITDLCFVLHKKVHIKGFSFQKYNRAWQKLQAGECDSVYGDSFTKDGMAVRGIGNNVTLTFEHLEFGEAGAVQILLCGKTDLDKNAVILKYSDGETEDSQLLEFQKGSGVQSFPLRRICGTQTVRFVFLPGCSFDFEWVQFQGDDRGQ